ncbi:hypothetical protein Q1695_009565 [Nippostrongylus brasiliensis]|nr:hypothetical protein Q1695_009565 [Nippostrongylus brasiliensis]
MAPPFDVDSILSQFTYLGIEGGGGGCGGGGQVVAGGTVGGGGGGGGGEQERYMIIEDDGDCRPQCKRCRGPVYFLWYATGH